MIVCPSCSRQYLIGEGWIPPPCLFKSSTTIRELPSAEKCLFTHIECECGQHIGVKVISGPKKNIGYWRMQFECQNSDSIKNEDFQVAKSNLTKEELKHIYQSQLTNRIYKMQEVQMENKARIFMIEKMARKFGKKSRNKSL